MKGIENKNFQYSGDTKGYSSLSPDIISLTDAAPREYVLESGLIVANYEIGETLGRTRASEVSRAVNLDTGEKVALKVPRSRESALVINHEIDVHRCIGRLPFVVLMDGYGQWQDRPFIATRVQEGGTLSSAIDKKHSSTVSGMVDLLREEITEAKDEEVDEPALVEAVDNLLLEGLPRELAEVIDSKGTVQVDEIVDVVVHAAHDLGHDINPDSVMAKGIALRLLENEISHDKLPGKDELKGRIRVLGGAAVGVSALHDVGFIHRDIKPSNIGIDLTGAGKLIDLGISGHPTDDDPDTSVWGSLGENISPEGYRGIAREEGDVWALGATAFRALTGTSAFETPEERTLLQYYRKTVAGPLYSVRERNPVVPSDVDDVVMAALHPKFDQRPSVDEMREVFERAQAA